MSSFTNVLYWLWLNNLQITLPSPGNFSRSSFVPFYVVFNTTPKSSALAREIAADATISVSLVRQVTVSAPSSAATSPPLTPSTSGDSDSPPSNQMFLSRHKLFNRVTKSAPILSRLGASRIPEETATSSRDKPLPHAPPKESAAFCESRILQTDIFAGFPKRPRNRRHQQEASARIDSDVSLPDGLYKGKLQLNNTMLPGIDWYNVSVKVSCPLHLICQGTYVSEYSIIWTYPSYSAKMKPGHAYRYEYTEGMVVFLWYNLLSCRMCPSHITKRLSFGSHNNKRDLFYASEKRTKGKRVFNT